MKVLKRVEVLFTGESFFVIGEDSIEEFERGGAGEIPFRVVCKMEEALGLAAELKDL